MTDSIPLAGPVRADDAESWLHDMASARCGLHDFGAPDYREGLRSLLQSLEHELPRDAQQREACLMVPLGLLVSRLYTEQGRRLHPEAQNGQIARPVFIVGAPRTGTTALHQMLAADPAWQGLDSWLTRTPMPRPERGHWDEFPEFRTARDAHDARMAAFPDFRKMHAVAPDEVDECIHVTSQTMVTNTFGSIMHVPGYDAWFRRQDMRPSFRRLAEVLNLIGGHDPRRWLLKNPSHVLDLAELLEIFPDSIVIYTHRDPLVAQPSLWSLLALHRRSRDGAMTDPAAIARREMELFAPALDRNIAIAAAHPGRVLEVLQDELIANPIGLAARIYAFAGQELSDAAGSAIATWVAGNAQGKHGEHRYAADDYGVSRAELAERFAAYRAHYGFTDRP